MYRVQFLSGNTKNLKAENLVVCPAAAVAPVANNAAGTVAKVARDHAASHGETRADCTAVPAPRDAAAAAPEPAGGAPFAVTGAAVPLGAGWLPEDARTFANAAAAGAHAPPQLMPPISVPPFASATQAHVAPISPSVPGTVPAAAGQLQATAAPFAPPGQHGIVQRPETWVSSFMRNSSAESGALIAQKQPARPVGLLERARASSVPAKSAPWPLQEAGFSDAQAKARPSGLGRGGRGQSWPPGRGRGRGGMPREVRISKAMSTVLRHTGASLGLLIRPDGFCRVEELLKVRDLQALDCTVADMQEAVRSSDKKRFDLLEEGGELLVRASQGHSMKVVSDDSLLRRLHVGDKDLPQVCVHGTYQRHVASILQKGLIPGGGMNARNHVHFAPFEPGDGRVISGMRFNCEVAVFLDLRRALRDGVPFFLSTNQVLLSPGVNNIVPVNYISGVKNLQSGQWIYGGP